MAISITEHSRLMALEAKLRGMYRGDIKVHTWHDFQTATKLFGVTANGGVKAGPFDSIEALMAACKVMFGEKA